MKARALIFLGCIAFSASAFSSSYKVDHARSSLAFSGTHADNPFKGKFEQWDAVIEFDPAHLEKSKLEVTIDTASAKTGNVMYDGTLPTVDWFDVKNFPKATFISKEIRTNADGSYTASGELTIRNKTNPISFAFTLEPKEIATAAEVKTKFTFTIDRLAFSLGEKSDAKAEWVGRDITMNVEVVVRK